VPVVFWYKAKPNNVPPNWKFGHSTMWDFNKERYDINSENQLNIGELQYIKKCIQTSNYCNVKIVDKIDKICWERMKYKYNNANLNT
jgi:hypothetical protein